QGVAPQPVQEFGFARTGLKLYVQGGRYVENNRGGSVSKQLYALDLSTSWSADSPPWQALLQGPSQFFHNAVVTGDNQTFVTIGSDGEGLLYVAKYSILSNTWTGFQLILPAISESRQGLRPVIDPTTSLIYIIAGTYLDIMNPFTNQVNQQVRPPEILESRLFAGSVYNAARKSLMYFGGLKNDLTLDPAATYITEYDIASSSWSIFPTTGELPAPRADFCMAASDDGLTVVVYGGRVAPPTNHTSSLHVLDVRTGQWTRETDGDIRLYMACTIAGDQFLAWGGTNTTDTYKGPPIIFNLSSRKWTNTYTAPEYKQTTPTQSASVSKDDSPNNLGPILGGIFGALFIVAMSGIVYICLKRKQKRANHNPSPKSEQQPLQNLNPNNKLITTEQVPVVQFQQSNKSQVRNPHSATLDLFALRDPQDVNAMGIVIPGSRPQPPTTHVVLESMGPSVTGEMSSVSTPAFAMVTQGQPVSGTMLYVPGVGYTPTNMTTAAALPYRAPNSQVFYSPGVNGNMYSSAYQVFTPADAAYLTNTTDTTGYTAVVSDNGAYNSGEVRTGEVNVGGAGKQGYVPPPPPL
ncbi:hypothetical protein BGZ50_009683, partial [Haplosporangium sp. Z 11]